MSLNPYESNVEFRKSFSVKAELILSKVEITSSGHYIICKMALPVKLKI